MKYRNQSTCRPNLRMSCKLVKDENFSEPLYCVFCSDNVESFEHLHTFHTVASNLYIINASLRGWQCRLL